MSQQTDGSTAKATRTTKKAASTFAAWLVAQQMGWT
jgi:hypothetical protein